MPFMTEPLSYTQSLLPHSTCQKRVTKSGPHSRGEEFSSSGKEVYQGFMDMFFNHHIYMLFNFLSERDKGKEDTKEWEQK